MPEETRSPRAIERTRRSSKAQLRRVAAPFRGWWPRLSDAAVGMFALLVVAFALLTYSTSISRYTSELLSDNKYLALVNGMLNPFRTRHMLLNSGLPIYDLSVKKQQYARIEDAVAKARAQGFMDDSLKVWADARFIREGESYNVKLRVRGDLPPHWKGEKKSWRIKFGKQPIEHEGQVRNEPIYFEGRRQINLIIPSDRDYILGYFINSILREAGMIVPRDRFVVLRINGALQGLYYEVEHFDKPLLAANRRPETTVFAQNDRAMHFDKYGKYGAPGASDARFDMGAVRRLVDRTGELGARAMQVLIDHSIDPTPERFRRVRMVLDWDRYLRFRVLTTLCNTNHVRFGSDNLRLYYDESRGLLEPIPWDLHISRLPPEPGTIDFWNSHGPDTIQSATLEDPELRLARNRVLWDLVADGGDELISRYEAIHQKIRPLAWADVLSTPIQGHKMDVRRKDLRYNVHRVHKVLSHSSANLTYARESADRASLSLAVTNFSGLDVEGVRLSSPGVFEGSYRLVEDANENGRLDPGDPVVGEATARDGTLEFPWRRRALPEVEYRGDWIDGRWWEFYDTRARRVRLFLDGRVEPEETHPLEWEPPSIEVQAANSVTGAAVRSAALTQNEALPADTIAVLSVDASDTWDLDATELSLAQFLERNPEFQELDTRADSVVLRGPVVLDRTVLVPKSVSLVVAPGTELSLAPKVSLVAYGGLELNGTAKAPVRISGTDPEAPWGVVAAVRPRSAVIGRHLEVTGGGQAQVNGILFTGGFAVHEGDLELDHCRFVGMQSEDGVNLKNGRILVRNCLFASGASDGMDLDFVTGEVRDSVFLDNDGDGLDLSGSQVLVVGNRFERMGDKGISVGENSQPVIVDTLIRDNPIGISSKDLSFSKVAHSTFIGNALAIEAKRKKPFFGGGGGEFLNNVFARNVRLLQEDSFSQGRVQLSESVVDVTDSNCKKCRTGALQFVSLAGGDYRLRPDDLPEPQPVDWAISAWGTRAGRARVPGIVSLSPGSGGSGE